MASSLSKVWERLKAWLIVLFSDWLLTVTVSALVTWLRSLDLELFVFSRPTELLVRYSNDLFFARPTSCTKVCYHPDELISLA